VRGAVRVPDDGTLQLTAASIAIDGEIDGRHVFPGGHGAHVRLQATGGIDVNGRVDTSGAIVAGTITIEAGGTLDYRGKILTTGPGDAQVVLRGADVTVGRRIRASSGFPTGMLRIEAIGDVVVDADLVVTPGGTIVVSSTAGNVTVNKKLRASSTCCYSGGTVTVESGADLFFAGRATVRSYNGDGAIQLIAQGDAVLGPSATLDARGSGGTIRIEGRSVTASARVTASAPKSHQGAGGDGGELRFKARDGDLVLNGRFNATATGGGIGAHGGTIEGTATNNVTASGTFRCAPDGCIGFGAGGALDTSGADFDKPLVGDCPGSPSSAFLDG